MSFKNIIANAVPEIIIMVIGIALLYFGIININISPPPKDLNEIQSQFNKTYCLPVTRLDATSEDKSIRDAANNAYRLMVASVISGFLLIVLDLFMIFQKYREPSLVYVDAHYRRVQK